MTRRRIGGIKRGESSLASNQLHMYSPQSGTPIEGHRVTEREEKREEGEVTRRRRGAIKRRETDLASNHFPKCSPQPGIPKEIPRVGERRKGSGRR